MYYDKIIWNEIIYLAVYNKHKYKDTGATYYLMIKKTNYMNAKRRLFEVGFKSKTDQNLGKTMIIISKMDNFNF